MTGSQIHVYPDHRVITLVVTEAEFTCLQTLTTQASAVARTVYPANVERYLVMEGAIDSLRRVLYSRPVNL